MAFLTEHIFVFFYSRGEGLDIVNGRAGSSSTPSNYNSNTDINSHSIKSPYSLNDSTNFHRKHGMFGDLFFKCLNDNRFVKSIHSQSDIQTNHNY